MAKLIITSNTPTPVVWEESVIVVYNTPPESKRTNQKSVKFKNGSIKTYDRGNTEVQGSIRLRRLSPKQHASLNSFIVNVLNFNEHKYSLQVVNELGDEGYDLGMGRGILVKNCNMGDNFISTKGMWEWKAPDVYHCVFPFRFSKGEQV